MMKMPRIDMQATGKRIKTLRKNCGVTVEQLCELLQLAAPRAIYKWQRGDTLPTLDNLIMLASIFGTTMDNIIVKEEAGGDEKDPPVSVSCIEMEKEHAA